MIFAIRRKITDIYGTEKEPGTRCICPFRQECGSMYRKLHGALKIPSSLDRGRHPCSFPPHFPAVLYDESMLGILRNRSSQYVIGRAAHILGGTDIRDARRRVAVEHFAPPCHGYDSIKRQSIPQTIFYIEKWMAQITDSF